jgi:hypothetical protein
MAPDLGYLPVRLTHFEKGSKQLDIKLLNYQFSEPAQPNKPLPTEAEATTQTP